MNFLRAVKKKPIPQQLQDQFPFNLPVVQLLDSLETDCPVTIFVGDNGSGKSTLLEAMAIAANLVTIGSEDLNTDPTLANHRQFAQYLQMVWNRRPQRGFFLRAEDFFGFTRRLAQERAAMLEELEAVDARYQGRSQLALTLARAPYRKSLYAWEERYGTDLDANSHGETFLKVFQARFVPGGLYLLDEPETPLSFNGELAFMGLLSEMVQQDSQFIIATHSPLLMAYPNAKIYSFDSLPPQVTAFDDVDSVRLTRDFLNNPDRFFRYLLER